MGQDIPQGRFEGKTWNRGWLQRTDYVIFFQIVEKNYIISGKKLHILIRAFLLPLRLWKLNFQLIDIIVKNISWYYLINFQYWHTNCFNFIVIEVTYKVSCAYFVINHYHSVIITALFQAFGAALLTCFHQRVRSLGSFFVGGQITTLKTDFNISHLNLPR